MRLYHCAFTFGKAIRLTVEPNGTVVAPNLFVLSPLLPDDWMGDVKDLPPEVCLATDFRPKGEMILNVKDGSLTLNTTNVLLSQKSNSYVFAGFTNQTIFSCELHNTFSNNENINRCADMYPEKAKLNFLLLLMNGVRLVFTKTLAFSTLFTIGAALF